MKHTCATESAEIEKLRLDHAHLTKLYAESRDYVATLRRERDDLVAVANLDVAARDQLDAICVVARDLVRACKLERPALSALSELLIDKLDALLLSEIQR